MTLLLTFILNTILCFAAIGIGEVLSRVIDDKEGSSRDNK